MDPALKASLMRLGRNVFLVVLTVVLVVWGFNYVTETVRVQNLQAARQNQGSGMPPRWLATLRIWMSRLLCRLKWRAARL